MDSIITQHLDPDQVHFLFITGTKSDIYGFKNERAVFSRTVDRLRKEGKTVTTAMCKTKDKLISALQNVTKEEQLVMFYSGDGKVDQLTLDNDDTYLISDIAAEHPGGILFTSSASPFSNSIKNFTLIGERRGIIYDTRSKVLTGVFADVFSIEDERDVCYRVKSY